MTKTFQYYLELTWEMTKRDLSARYRGSLLGVAWSLVTPVLMLLVYTFVFGVVFKARWGGTELDSADFALALFTGLLTFGIFSESVNRSPSLILGHQNLVKKVVFPLEILPLMAVLTAVIQAGISLAVLLVACIVMRGGLPWTTIYVPLVLAPVILLTLGFTWGLSAMGVFLRDIGQGVAVVTTALMFLTPIFYPLEALPESYRHLAASSPLAVAVENMRQVVLWGKQPDWSSVLVGLAVSVPVAITGYGLFMRTKKGFADVL